MAHKQRCCRIVTAALVLEKRFASIGNVIADDAVLCGRHEKGEVQCVRKFHSKHKAATREAIHARILAIPEMLDQVASELVERVPRHNEFAAIVTGDEYGSVIGFGHCHSPLQPALQATG